MAAFPNLEFKKILKVLRAFVGCLLSEYFANSQLLHDTLTEKCEICKICSRVSAQSHR